jgi:cholesterol oxidase
VTTIVRSLPGEPAFTVAAPTSTVAAMRVVASWGRPRGRWLRPLAPLLWPRLGGLLSLALRSGALSRPLPWPLRSAGDPERMTFLFAMGRDDAGGRAVLRRGRLDVRWRYARDNAGLVGAVQQAVTDLGRAYGGSAQPLVTWSAFRRPVSFHPLGGCALSQSPETGVVAPNGEVHGCPGLFVADASLLPASLGVHPAMTVAALAEHVARRGVLRDVAEQGGLHLRRTEGPILGIPLIREGGAHS